jgi:hypothetical protein
MTLATTLTFYYEFSWLASHSSHPTDQKLFSTQRPCSKRHVCLSLWLSVLLLTESKTISYNMSAASNTSERFALFLPYFFNSYLFSRKTLKLHYLQYAFPRFTLHTLQVSSVCKQQIYSLSEYIPRKGRECICCTYVVKCKIYKSYAIIICSPQLLLRAQLLHDRDHNLSQLRGQITTRHHKRRYAFVWSVCHFFFILTIIDTCPQIL